jgi:hypothetical protein
MHKAMADSATLRRKKEELAGLKSAAIARLEQRGYEVLGKNTTQIRKILKRRPTRLPSAA